MQIDAGGHFARASGHRPTPMQGGSMRGSAESKFRVSMPSDDGELATEGMAATGPGTMKAQLQALSFEDPGCVFIVRRINKLGFASSGQLRLYFSNYGEVKSVHVSHSRVKSLRHFSSPDRSRDNSTVQWRLRAAALGFVVMQSREAIQRILENGPEHEIHSVMVRVHPFHRRRVGGEGGLADGEPEVEPEELGPSSTSLLENFFEDELQEQQAAALHHRQFSPNNMQPYEDTTPQFQPMWSPNNMPYQRSFPSMEGCGAAYGMCEGMPLSPGLLYVSEQDLQDAMPAQYED